MDQSSLAFRRSGKDGYGGFVMVKLGIYSKEVCIAIAILARDPFTSDATREVK